MTTNHPTAELLEAFAENALGTAERALIDAHILTCVHCGGAVEEWRHLFGALDALPRYTPAPGFAERILASVKVPLPWHARAARLLERLLPSSNRGWAIAAALFALPTVAAGTLLVWLLSKSYVTAAALWIFAVDRGTALAGAAVSGLGSALVDSGPVSAVYGWVQAFLATFGPRGVGATLIAAASMTALSSWVLYKNLRTPNRDESHVTFVF